MSVLFGTLALAVLPGDAKVTWNVPTRFVRGLAFPVAIRIEAPEDGASIADWLLTPGAFMIDGRPVQERQGDGIVTLAEFELGFAKEYLENEPVLVRVYERAPEGTDFMALRAEELTDYQVIFETNRGNMVFEFFPDKAPMHVRNFLDLCQSGFYVGTKFHRVSPNFMIQGGDPNTKADDVRRWGQGGGPRRLDLEANDVKHERGILSMARSNDPNSASCQFFVMTARTPSLDNQYSAFGKLVAGDETLDLIAKAKGNPLPGDSMCVRPSEAQQVVSTTVIRAARAEGSGQ
jgi:cyclophilin family peptidyl-prolyl cis-trans isomerase